MKKMLLIMVLLAFVGVSVAVAADSYTYENSKGNITFNHKAHQERLKGDCAKCHGDTTPPAKIEVNKDFGHNTCKACHKEMNGPTKCNDCHKK